SLQALISWVVNLHDDDLVLVLLGDHQPLPAVTGPDATHQVPLPLVPPAPAVLARIADWDWQDGLLPSPTAPVWPMDAFRDRFLDAFTTTSGAQALRPTGGTPGPAVPVPSGCARPEPGRSGQCGSRRRARTTSSSGRCTRGP